MLSSRDAKQKIRTVRSIQQICRAMKTVASIRLRRAEQRLAAARPYYEQVASLAARVAAITQEHPFLEVRPVHRIGMVVVTSDRGLAGGYNAAVIRHAQATARPDLAAVIPVGRRGQGQLANRGYEVLEGLVPLGGEPDIMGVWRLAGRLGQLFRQGQIDQVMLVYTHFRGGTRSQVVSEVVLPVVASPDGGGDTLFEPGPAELLAGLMDRYLRSQILGAVLESSASEHGARVAAMTNASDNAEDLIRSLTLAYNKARQASITREIAEIVGSSDATA